jgi:hypothetical protein
LNHGLFNPVINATFIALIPKVASTAYVTEYKPISLCNVLYKLIAKMLANRLKQLLPFIISINQSAFVPGVLIMDNVLVAYEALHSMDTRMKGKKGFMVIKLDMGKAYDRVEWSYLEAMMRRMGFVEQWIRLIMTCVCSVSYSVLINGAPLGKILQTKGLRQGDPLSPYLFLLVAEGLSSLLTKAESDGRLTGVPIAFGGTRLSHLLFADDSLLFCRATFSEWLNLTQLLQSYEQASGQKLNADKTSLFFSKNIGMEFREFICSSAGISSTSCYEKYLGLPALVGRSKTSTFIGIQSRVRKKLDGWKEKFLSQAGREILIKAVVQAIPRYSMSVFRLPKKLCSSLNSMIKRFWWGHSDEAKHISWMSWGRLGKSKLHGGMGFRDLEAFNGALLAKQGWRLVKYPDSLVARVLRRSTIQMVSTSKQIWDLSILTYGEVSLVLEVFWRRG